MPNQTELIAPSTTARDSDEITLSAGETVTLITNAKIGDEPITLECKAGANWQAIKEQSDPGVSVHGSMAQISASNNIRQIHGPVTFRAIKPVTDTAVGVWLDR